MYKRQGQTLQGNIAVERSVSFGPDGVAGGGDDHTMVRIAATDVSMSLGDGTRTLVSLTNGQALLVLPGTGLAGSISGTLAVTGVPGLTLSGSFAVEVNSTGGAVDETFVVGGVTTTITFAANAPLRVSGTGCLLYTSRCV